MEGELEHDTLWTEEMQLIFDWAYEISIDKLGKKDWEYHRSQNGILVY